MKHRLEIFTGLCRHNKEKAQMKEPAHEYATGRSDFFYTYTGSAYRLRINALVVSVILLIFLAGFQCCRYSSFDQGMHYFQNHEFSYAARYFARVSSGDPDYESARVQLVRCYIKLSKYKLAEYHLDEAGFPSGVAGDLRKQVQTCSSLHTLIEDRVESFEKRVKRSLPDVPHDRKTGTMLVDFILNDLNSDEFRTAAAGYLHNTRVIEENEEAFMKLAKSIYLQDKLLALQVFRNYLILRLYTGDKKKHSLEWPATHFVQFFKKWMGTVLTCGSRELKNAVIKTCAEFPDTTSLEILIPVFTGKDDRFVNKVKLKCNKYPDLQPLLSRYDAAPAHERRNIVDFVRGYRTSEAYEFLKKVRFERDWKTGWWAEEALTKSYEFAKPAVKREPESSPKKILFDANEASLPVKHHAVKKPVHEFVSGTRHKNIILISLDMLRADRLGCYGFPERTSPFLDYFSKRNIQFQNTVSQSSWTLPSHASMLSSRNPGQLGVHSYEDYLSNNEITIAEILKENSYLTLGLITNTNVSSQYGFSQGFDIYDDKYRQPGEISMDYLLKWIHWYHNNSKNGTITKPFFFFLHMNDIHGPYRTNQHPFNKMFKHLEKNVPDWDSNHKDAYPMYHSMIYYVDKQLGKLFAELRKLRVLKDYIIIITSDHGEAFQEHHYFGHGVKGHYEELTVPLFIYSPDIHKHTIVSDLMAQTIDIAPTILAGIHIPVPAFFEGHNLLDIIGKKLPHVSPPDILSETHSYSTGNVFRTLVSGNYKFILPQKGHHDDSQSEELYDLQNDPLELFPLPRLNTHLYQLMKNKLESITQTQNKGTPETNRKTILDEDLVLELKQLGYMQ